jgi:hypothetical protein
LEQNEIDKKEEEDFEKLAAANKKKGFMGRLAGYNTPKSYVALGIFASLVQGFIFPIMGIYYTKCLFILMDLDKEKMMDGIKEYCLYFVILGVVGFFGGLI